MRYVTPVSVRGFDLHNISDIERGYHPNVVTQHLTRSITPPARFQSCWARPVTPNPPNKDSRHRGGERPPSTSTSRSSTSQRTATPPATTPPASIKNKHFQQTTTPFFHQASCVSVFPTLKVSTRTALSTDFTTPLFSAPRTHPVVNSLTQLNPITQSSGPSPTSSVAKSYTSMTALPLTKMKGIQPFFVPERASERFESVGQSGFTQSPSSPDDTKLKAGCPRPVCHIPLERFRAAVTNIASQPQAINSGCSAEREESQSESSTSDCTNSSAVEEVAADPSHLLRTFTERRLKEKSVEWRVAQKRLRSLKADVKMAQTRLKESREEYAATTNAIDSMTTAKEDLKVRVANLQKFLLTFDAGALPNTADGVQLKQAVISLQNANHCKIESERLEDLAYDKEMRLKALKRDIQSQKRNIRGDTEQLVLRHKALESRLKAKNATSTMVAESGITQDAIEDLVEEIEMLSLTVQANERFLSHVRRSEM